MNGEKYLINPHQIEMIESAADTVVSLVSGRKLMVKDKAEELTASIVKYRRSLGLPVAQEF